MLQMPDQVPNAVAEHLRLACLRSHHWTSEDANRLGGKDGEKGRAGGKDGEKGWAGGKERRKGLG